MITFLTSIAFWCEALIRGRCVSEGDAYFDPVFERFETVWNGATLIKERCLFEVRPLFILDDLNVNKQSSCQFSDRPDRGKIRVYYKNPHVSLKTYIWISLYKKSYQQYLSKAQREKLLDELF